MTLSFVRRQPDVHWDQLVTLFHAQHAQLVRLAGVLVGDTAAAEELVQDSYVRMYRALPRLADDDAAVAYLRRIVVNSSYSHLRRRRVAARHATAVDESSPASDVGVLVGDDRGAVVAAVRQLPDRQRACIVLRYYEDLSERRIAEVLGISQNSVKKHLQRAMAALGTRLEDRR